MAAVTIREANVAEMLEHAKTLFEEHVEDLTTNKERMVLKPDDKTYYAMEAAGSIIILVAEKEGEMVGYCVTFVTKSLHYSDLIYATNDLLFVRKKHRQGTVGLKLIRAVEQNVKDRGADMIMWHAKPDTPFDKLLPRLGYGLQDKAYMKEL